jgi:Holliday junction resolvase RusA-like endonuclease
MDPVYQFEVIGDPVAKARPKFRNITTKAGKSFVSTYTPKKSVNFENQVSNAFSAKYGPVIPTEKSVKLEIFAHFMPPKSIPKYKKAEIENGLVRFIKRPDIDNVLKSVLDALNQVVYQDDNQVYSITCAKYYSYRPRTIIRITTEEELEKDELPF